MSIENIPGVGTVVTGSSIEIFAMRSVIGRLQLETHGIRFKEPTLKYARESWKLRAKTRSAAIRELQGLINEQLKRELSKEKDS